MVSSLRIFKSLFLVKVKKPTTSFEGKTVIITGANTGLGYEAAKQYISLKASKVILGCRSLEKATKAKLSLEESSNCGPDVIETWDVDLSSYQSVIRFCERAKGLDRIDVLLLNAGIMTNKFRTVEGNESTLTVNVISTFLMGFLMMPKLKETAQKYSITPHMTVVSSDLHIMSRFPERKSDDVFGTLNDAKTARMSDRYNVTKLIVILIVRHFASLKGPEFPVVFNISNPSWCKSGLQRESPVPGGKIMESMIARSGEDGASILVMTTAAGKESHGKYFSDGEIKTSSDFVESKDGILAGEKVWNELTKKLESISPGLFQDV